MTDPRVHHPATNLRELGGYVAADGRRIRRGVFYRSGRMNELDADGHEIFTSLGLRTVIDLRRDDEVEEAPTPRFGDETTEHISVSTGDNSFAVAASHIDSPDGAQEVLRHASGYYRGLVSDRLPRFQPVFDLILDVDRHPVLFHCTAGKDRTGFVAAAILKFLDVDDDTVMADYMLTRQVRAAFVDERLAFHRDRIAREKGIPPTEVDPAPLDALRTLLTTDERLLRATFETVTEHYGTWHDLRRDGLGITDDRLDRFREAVLEP